LLVIVVSTCVEVRNCGEPKKPCVVAALLGVRYAGLILLKPVARV